VIVWGNGCRCAFASEVSWSGFWLHSRALRAAPRRQHSLLPRQLERTEAPSVRQATLVSAWGPARARAARPATTTAAGQHVIVGAEGLRRSGLAEPPAAGMVEQAAVRVLPFLMVAPVECSEFLELPVFLKLAERVLQTLSGALVAKAQALAARTTQAVLAAHQAQREPAA
jgi:hypothetical protein